MSSAAEALAAVEARLGTLGAVGTVGYLLRQGGTTFRQPVTRIEPDTLRALLNTGPSALDGKRVLGQLVERGLAALPRVPHLLFSDTAYFADLPEHVCRYAVPRALGGAELRRHGGFGLCHEWVWEAVQSCCAPPPAAVISVVLGEVPNVAAIRHGRAVDTTMGFTAVEGLTTARSSGELDPTVVFDLLAAGYGFGEVTRMLTEESGLAAWLGRACTLDEVASNPGAEPALTEARDLLGYQIVKAVGAFAAVLGGVDAVAFVTEDLATYQAFIRSLAGRLAFLSVTRTEPVGPPTADVLRLTAAGSRVQVVGLEYDRWRCLRDRAARP